MPSRLFRRALQLAGMHPDDKAAGETANLPGRRNLVICTNHGVLDIGKPTGVFASEMTASYHVFLDAAMDVDVASPLGGTIPVDPLSLKPVLRCAYDDRFPADDELQEKISDSKAVGDLDMADYDIVYRTGGWGAAFGFGSSEDLAKKITEATLGRAVGGVCHDPLGLRNATTPDGRPLVQGPRSKVQGPRSQDLRRNRQAGPGTRLGLRCSKPERPAMATSGFSRLDRPFRAYRQAGHWCLVARGFRSRPLH